MGPVYSKYTNGKIKHICREGKAANRLLQNKIGNKFVESIVKGNVKSNVRYVSLFIHSFIHSFTCLSIYVCKYLFIYLFISLYKSDGDATPEAGRSMWVWLKLSPKVDFCLVSARAFFCKFLYAQY